MAATPKPVRKAIKKDTLSFKSKETPRTRGYAKMQKESMTDYAKGKTKEESKKMIKHLGKMTNINKKKT